MDHLPERRTNTRMMRLARLVSEVAMPSLSTPVMADLLHHVASSPLASRGKWLWRRGLLLVSCRRISTNATSLVKELPTRLASSTEGLSSRVRALGDRLRQSKSLHQVMKLQFESFAQRHGLALMALGVFISGICLWQIHSALWRRFGGKTRQTYSTIGSLGLTVMVLALIVLYLHRRFGLNPDAVHRLALLKLNTHPGILEVMGAPLVSGDATAMVLSGGGMKLMGWLPHLQPRRVKMVFPVHGTQRHGHVFLDAKKQRGKYVMKVLGVDIPLPDDQEQRLYVSGDSTVFSKGGVLTALRDPLTKIHVAATLDALEDAKDAEREREERKAKQEHRRRERQEKSPKGLDEGGGMYLYERLYWRVRKLSARLPFWKQNQP